MDERLRCFLLGARGGGGEEVFLKDLLSDPPAGVDYTAVLDPHRSAPGARAQAWTERAFNRVLHPRIWPLGGLRAYDLDEGFDVVHVHNETHRIRTRVPVIMSLGGATYRHYLRRYLGLASEEVDTLYRRADLLYRRLGITNEFVHWEPLAALVVFSHFAAGWLQDGGVPASRIHVIPPGFPDPGPLPLPPPEPYRVVLVGRQPGRKGADTAVAAVRLLRSRGLAVELTLVGDEEYPRWTEPGTTGIPPIDRSRIFQECYGGAHAVLVPSREEGYGFAAVEAMACGRPVLVANTGALPEVVGDGGRVVEHPSPEAWAESIAALMFDPAASRALGDRGRSRFEQMFTRERFRGRLRALYDEVRGSHF